MSLRTKFHIPTFGSMGIVSGAHKPTDNVTYFCGNSLGLAPKKTQEYLEHELKVWQNQGVEGHFDHDKTCWMDIDLPIVPKLAQLVGALETEVAVMGTLTGNLNALLRVFYKPSGKKTKILFDKGAFPSDYYAFLNQVKLNVATNDAESHLLQVAPKDGEFTLNTSDVLQTIEAHHEEIALLCLPGIQYYTGQLFEIEKITAFAHKFGITVGWDLAHVAGNVPLQLHDWNVDFACWCSYKYLNSGPGAIGGFYINEKYATNPEVPRFAGWWGNDASVRFKMEERFTPIEGALGFRQSNPSVLDVVSLQASLDTLSEIDSDLSKVMQVLRKRSFALTARLESGLLNSKYYVPVSETHSCKEAKFTIITPSDPNQRGAQLSLLFLPLGSGNMQLLFDAIRLEGVIGDERKPNVIRLAPAPLYNTEEEVDYVVETIENCMAKL